MSLIRKHGAVLQAWACLDLVICCYCCRLVWLHIYRCVFVLVWSRSCMK